MAMGPLVSGCADPSTDVDLDERIASDQLHASSAHARTLLVAGLADPEVLKVHDDLFFLMGTDTSTFTSLPIYESTDLVTVTERRRYRPSAVDPAHDYCDVWAPDLSLQEGVYHLYFSANRVPEGGACPAAGQDVTTFHVTAPDTSFAFGPPELVNQGTPWPRSRIAAGCPSDGCSQAIRIDSSIFDDGGRRRLFYVWFQGGNNISSFPLSSPGSVTHHAGPAVFPGDMEPFEETINEGPDIFTRNGVYYMFFSGGQFNGQYAMYYLMADSVVDLTRARQVRRHSMPRRAANGQIAETHGHNAIVSRRGELFNLFHVGSFDAAGRFVGRSTHAQKLAFKPDGSILPLNFVDLRWGKLGAHLYSLDVVRRDGSSIGPCIGAGLLGSSTSVRYTGVCPSADGLLVPKDEIESFRLFYSDNGVWTKSVESAYDGVSDRVFLAISGAATQAVTVSWNEKATGTEYSLDVQRADGSWIAPCAGDHLLSTGISYELNGACPTANATVNLRDVRRLQICSAVADDWAHAICGGAAYDGQQGHVDVTIP